MEIITALFDIPAIIDFGTTCTWIGQYWVCS